MNLAEYPGGNGQRYETFVIRADYGAPGDADDPPERSVAWNLEFLDLEDAAVFSFRASNVDDVDMCAPVDGDSADAADFDIVFVGGDDVDEVTVSVADYARLVAPDVFMVLNPNGTVGMCPVSHFLQTVRIPLDEVLCDSFPPEDLREVRFVFDRTAGPATRAVLLDTVEFHRDLSGAPICD